MLSSDRTRVSVMTSAVNPAVTPAIRSMISSELTTAAPVSSRKFGPRLAFMTVLYW